MLGALTDRRVLLMCLVAVGLVIGTTGVAVWMPQIVQAFGLTTMQTGFVAAIPSLAMAVAMVVSGRHADRTGERVWHVAAPFLASAAGFLLAAATASPVLGLIGLTIGAAGVGAATPNIWVFPHHPADGRCGGSRRRADQLRRQHGRLLRSGRDRLDTAGQRVVCGLAGLPGGHVRDGRPGCPAAGEHDGPPAHGRREGPPTRRIAGERPMKITEIRGYHLRCMLGEPIGNAVTFFDSKEALLVEVMTDAGVAGWGEAWSSPITAAAYIRQRLAPLVLGQDPTATGRLWRTMAGTAGYDRRGSAMMATAALDIALHDIAGQVRGVPVSALLGGALRDRATSLCERAVHEARRPSIPDGPRPGRTWAREGFRAFKPRGGFSPHEDGAMMLGLRRQLGPRRGADAGLQPGLHGARRDPGGPAPARCRSALARGAGRSGGRGRLSCRGPQAAPMAIAGGEALASLAGFRDFVAAGRDGRLATGPCGVRRLHRRDARRGTGGGVRTSCRAACLGRRRQLPCGAAIGGRAARPAGPAGPRACRSSKST